MVDGGWWVVAVVVVVVIVVVVNMVVVDCCGWWRMSSGRGLKMATNWLVGVLGVWDLVSGIGHILVTDLQCSR